MNCLNCTSCFTPSCLEDSSLFKRYLTLENIVLFFEHASKSQREKEEFIVSNLWHIIGAIRQVYRENRAEQNLGLNNLKLCVPALLYLPIGTLRDILHTRNNWEKLLSAVELEDHHLRPSAEYLAHVIKSDITFVDPLACEELIDRLHAAVNPSLSRVSILKTVLLFKELLYTKSLYLHEIWIPSLFRQTLLKKRLYYAERFSCSYRIELYSRTELREEFYSDANRLAETDIELLVRYWRQQNEP